jgi:hypothetical protein
MAQYECEVCNVDPATNHVEQRLGEDPWVRFMCDGCAPVDNKRFIVTELEATDFLRRRPTPNFGGMGRGEDPDAYDRHRDTGLTS